MIMEYYLHREFYMKSNLIILMTLYCHNNNIMHTVINIKVIEIYIMMETLLYSQYTVCFHK